MIKKGIDDGNDYSRGTEGMRGFERDLSFLFGLAAHEKMVHLLDLYHSNHIE